MEAPQLEKNHVQFLLTMNLEENITKLFNYIQVDFIYGNLCLVSKFGIILPNITNLGENFTLLVLCYEN